MAEASMLATKDQHGGSIYEDRLMQAKQSEYDKSLHHNTNFQVASKYTTHEIDLQYKGLQSTSQICK